MYILGGNSNWTSFWQVFSPAYAQNKTKIRMNPLSLLDGKGGENNFSRNKNSYFNLPEQIKLSWKLILTIFSSPGIRTQTEIIRKVCFQIYYTFLSFFFAFLCVYLNTFARTLSKQVYNTASYQRKNKLHRFIRLFFQWILFYFLFSSKFLFIKFDFWGLPF